MTVIVLSTDASTSIDSLSHTPSTTHARRSLTRPGSPARLPAPRSTAAPLLGCPRHCPRRYTPLLAGVTGGEVNASRCSASRDFCQFSSQRPRLGLFDAGSVAGHFSFIGGRGGRAPSSSIARFRSTFGLSQSDPDGCYVTISPGCCMRCSSLLVCASLLQPR